MKKSVSAWGWTHGLAKLGFEREEREIKVEFQLSSPFWLMLLSYFEAAYRFFLKIHPVLLLQDVRQRFKRFKSSLYAACIRKREKKDPISTF